MADSQKKSAQLFDWSAASFGYRIQWGTGNPYADETAIQSDYIPVSNGTYRNDLGYFILGYDASKNYVGSFNIDTRTWSKQFNNPSTYLYIQNNEVAYIKLLSYGSYEALSATTMFNAGNTQLPYEPYSSTGWLHSLRKLATATEAVENPLYSDGTAITAYTLKGNEEHTGTPSPQNPVMPNGVGDEINAWSGSWRQNSLLFSITENEGVFDVESTTSTGTNYFALNLNDTIPTDKITYFRITVQNGSSSLYSNGKFRISFRRVSNNSIVTGTQVNIGADGTYETSYDGSESVYASVIFCDANIVFSCEISNIVLSEGYKIPISSCGVTTNIYLGSTQTVRRIKKLVLDGSETWYINNQGTVNAFFSMVLANPLNVNLGISTHFIFKGIYTSNDDVGFYVTTTGDLRIRPDNVSSMTKSDFTTWLSQQYANGAPVTVWYVLATPETATVNEPLMKIGYYADTLSNATAIPTTEGANSITVDTTVQPSEFTATWTGWHDSSVKEYDGSQWNE